MATLIGAMAIGAIIYGFVQTSQRAEWTAYSLAAQNLAQERLEQSRAAKWDPLAFPPVDELVASNFPTIIDTLDVPVLAGQTNYATNAVFIEQVSTNPSVKTIRVQVTWRLGAGNHGTVTYTNEVATLRAADQ